MLVIIKFNLECEEWQRALAGTLSSVGTLLVLPFAGYISDRWGRRVALILSVFNLALIGFIRAFSVNYPMYLILQLLQTTFGAGTFSSAYIIAAEIVGPKFRVLTSATCTSMFALGQVILGAVAWLVQPWRYMIMALHLPCFIILTYYWILPESVRWLLSKQKYEDAQQLLQKIAKLNKQHLSQKTLVSLTNSGQADEMVGSIHKTGVIKIVLQSSAMLRRVCTTPIWWITMTFVYYGLSINAVSLSGNKYLNYILVSAIEIPGFFTAAFTLDRFGRRTTLSAGYFLSAACNIIFCITPDNLVAVRLLLYLVGKFGISVVFTSLYLYTSELYPTEYRHSLLAFSSMTGRIGSIVAPLTPLLMVYWTGLPSMLFGAMGVVSGFLVLTQPETLNTKMPDTVQEAEELELRRRYTTSR